jgi:hypothetical protein
VRIVDVSDTGCRIRTDSNYARIGSTVLLDFTHDRGTAGWVVWASDNERGIKFCETLSAEDIEFLAVALAA